MSTVFELGRCKVSAEGLNGGRGHAILLTIASWVPSEIMTGFPRIFETKCLSPKRLCRAGQRVVSRGAVAERTLRTSFCLKMALIGKTGIDAVRSRFAWKYNRSTVSGTNTGKGGKRAAKTKQFFFCNSMQFDDKNTFASYLYIKMSSVWKL